METIDRIIALAESPFIDLLVKGVLIYLAALWFAVVVWVARDIVNRSNNVLFQVSMILMNIALPVFGLILYLILRPSRTLLDKYYDELEYGFLSEHALMDENCTRCDQHLSADFLYCPSCSEQVKQKCRSCKNVFASNYVVCPYCGRKDRDEKASLKTSSKKKSSKSASTAKKSKAKAA